MIVFLHCIRWAYSLGIHCIVLRILPILVLVYIYGYCCSNLSVDLLSWELAISNATYILEPRATVGARLVCHFYRILVYPLVLLLWYKVLRLWYFCFLLMFIAIWWNCALYCAILLCTIFNACIVLFINCFVQVHLSQDIGCSLA